MKNLLETASPKILQMFIWPLIYVMLVTCYLLEGNEYIEGLTRALTDTFFYFVIIYCNILLLIPLFKLKFGSVIYGFGVLLLLLITTYVRVNLQHYFNTELFVQSSIINPILFRHYSYIFFSHALILLSSIAFKFAIDYFTIRVQKEQLAKKQALTELNLLKAQVQPHFLFNTLNNIYFFAEAESPKTAELIEQLAAIMRYFVEEAPKEKIPLETELNFIQNLINLEKMRMHQPPAIKIDINVTPGICVPPMLLIPLVENIFKHGINQLKENNTISLQIHQQEKTLNINVENTLYKDKKVKTTGTGLINLKNRLDLLFSDRYRFNAIKENGYFKVNMSLPL